MDFSESSSQGAWEARLIMKRSKPFFGLAGFCLGSSFVLPVGRRHDRDQPNALAYRLQTVVLYLILCLYKIKSVNIRCSFFFEHHQLVKRKPQSFRLSLFVISTLLVRVDNGSKDFRSLITTVRSGCCAQR